jgi:cytochrome c2
MRQVKVAVIAALAAATVAGAVQPAVADGDAARGKKLYQRTCINCHGDDKKAASVGPPLLHLLGRRAGTVNGTPYGRNLYASGIVWDETSLNRYLASPSDQVHGTIMPIGVDDPRDRDDIIAYLKTLE